jgi:hypothetical protein
MSLGVFFLKEEGYESDWIYTGFDKGARERRGFA